jgi:hypothetical protein
MATGFLFYLTGLAGSAFGIHQIRSYARRSRWAMAGLFMIPALLGILLTAQSNPNPVHASMERITQPVNAPLGEAKGLYPGRVVWIHDPASTNEKLTSPDQRDNAWFLSKNNDQNAIDRMLSDGIRALTGQSGDVDAWDAIFKSFNQKKGRGETGYQKGQTIFIKTNATSSWGGNFNTNDLSVNNNQWYGIAETSPQLMLSLLRQLVNVLGVDQGNIFIGDPIKHIYKHAFDLWFAEFPRVHYMDFDYGATKNREKFAFESKPNIFYSDKGAVMPNAVSDKLCTLYQTCDYMINVPTLKGHRIGGVTLFAKNHFGSQSRGSANHLHAGLINPTDIDPVYATPTRLGYGFYRVQVDLMAHKLLGENTLFFLMDALYAGPESIEKPTKWTITPFNNDWTSSIILSQDPVAIESVGYDLLKANYKADGPSPYAHMEGADDYLHQAADPANWPAGVTYDPENDGTPIGSLGVHEHWNNDIDKQYSRNLGTGDGIELVYRHGTTDVSNQEQSRVASDFRLEPNYPNPFNPITTLSFTLGTDANVTLEVRDVNGGRIATLVNEKLAAGRHSSRWNGTDGVHHVGSGTYFAVLTVEGSGKTGRIVEKMTLIK